MVFASVCFFLILIEGMHRRILCFTHSTTRSVFALNTRHSIYADILLLLLCNEMQRPLLGACWAPSFDIECSCK